MVVIRCRLSSKNKKLCLLKTLKHGFTKGNVGAFTKKIKNIVDVTGWKLAPMPGCLHVLNLQEAKQIC